MDWQRNRWYLWISDFVHKWIDTYNRWGETLNWSLYQFKWNRLWNIAKCCGWPQHRQVTRFGIAPPVACVAAPEAKEHSDVEELPEIPSRPQSVCSPLTRANYMIKRYHKVSDHSHIKSYQYTTKYHKIHKITESFTESFTDIEYHPIIHLLTHP